MYHFRAKTLQTIYPILNASNICLCVCVCVRLLLLDRYLDFDGNCRKLTVIIRSNYSAYFEVGGGRYPWGEEKGGELAILAILASQRACHITLAIMGYASERIILFSRSDASRGLRALRVTRFTGYIC